MTACSVVGAAVKAMNSAGVVVSGAAVDGADVTVNGAAVDSARAAMRRKWTVRRAAIKVGFLEASREREQEGKRQLEESGSGRLEGRV